MPKTKLFVAGVGFSPADNMSPLQLDGGVVEVVEDFKYLGSLAKTIGNIIGESDCDHHIAQASKAFDSLHSTVFMTHNLSLEIKSLLVYHSVVLGVLLHVVETWAPTQVLVRK